MNQETAQRYIPSTQDRMNHLLGIVSSDQQLNTVLIFENALSPDLLKQAVQITINYEPILGCRFVEEDYPYFEQISADESAMMNWSEVILSTSEEERNEQLQAFLTEPGMRMGKAEEPLVRCRLFRIGDEGAQQDILVVKLSHLCSDAAGAKEYIQLLSSVYTDLEESGNFEEVANKYVKSESAFRDQGPMFAHAGIQDVQSIMEMAMKSGGTGPITWSFPGELNANERPVYSMRRLPADLTESVAGFAKAHQSTINDVLLAAYYRALRNRAVYLVPENEPMTVAMTVDMRRYLPEGTTGTICNLSSMEYLQIKMEDGEDFTSMLHKVRDITSHMKRNMPGISSAVGIEAIAGADSKVGRAWLTSVQEAVAVPMITNLGIMADKSIYFGTHQAVDGYMTNPVMRAPYLTICANSYLGVLTLVTGYYLPAVNQADVESLLDSMVADISAAASL